MFNFNNFSQRCKSIYTKQIYGLNSWFKPFYSMQTIPQTFAQISKSCYNFIISLSDMLIVN